MSYRDLARERLEHQEMLEGLGKLIPDNIFVDPKMIEKQNLQQEKKIPNAENAGLADLPPAEKLKQMLEDEKKLLEKEEADKKPEGKEEKAFQELSRLGIQMEDKEYGNGEKAAPQNIDQLGMGNQNTEHAK